MLQLLAEATIVGFVVMVVGYCISCIIKLLWRRSIPTGCADWNKYHVMEISLFITGFVSHILFELLGLNKGYCKSGYACKDD